MKIILDLVLQGILILMTLFTLINVEICNSRDHKSVIFIPVLRVGTVDILVCMLCSTSLLTNT
jgi:hypothetical protein